MIAPEIKAKARKSIRSSIMVFGPCVAFEIGEALQIMFGSTRGAVHAMNLLGPKVQSFVDAQPPIIPATLERLTDLIVDTLTSPAMFAHALGGPSVRPRSGIGVLDQLLAEMETILGGGPSRGTLGDLLRVPPPRRAWDPGFGIVHDSLELQRVAQLPGQIRPIEIKVPIALPAALGSVAEACETAAEALGELDEALGELEDELAEEFEPSIAWDGSDILEIGDADGDLVRVPSPMIFEFVDRCRGDELPKLRTRVSELESELRDANTRGDGFERALHLERNKLRAFELPDTYPNGTFDTVGEHRDYLANWNGQLQDKIRAKDKTIGDLRGSVHKLEDQVRVEKAEIRALRAEVEKRAAEVEKRAEDERVLAARLESVEDRNRELRTKIGRVSSETKLVRDDRDHLREALDTVRDSVESMVRDGSISLEAAKRILARI